MTMNLAATSMSSISFATLAVLFSTLIALPGHTTAQEVVFSSGFEASEASQLDCVRDGYPCSLADADPAAIARVETLLQEIWDVRDNGTMDDVRSYLEGQPDVFDVDGNHRVVVFRVDGMPPTVFDDVTVVRGMVPDNVAGTAAGGAGKDRSGVQSERTARIEEVVGEDVNMDGTVDQKDIKRALVLAPYLWDFSPNDESADLASRLELLRGYAGNVVYKSNPNRDDANITIEDWLFLANYDVVAISTHGSRRCEILPDLSNRCQVWISSGVAQEWDEPFPVQVGVTAGGYYDDTDMESQQIGRISLGLDFWRFYYGGALDKRLISFSACETANTEGSTLAAAIGGDDFVMSGWTEVVYSSVAFPTILAFYEELAKGLTTREAYEIIAELGLFPYVDDENIEVDFEVFSPGNDEVRIVELPRLMYEDAEMPEGINIVDLVDGMVGDGNPDTLQLTVQIDGVTPESKPDFQVRYRVQDQEATSSYDLSSATLVGGYEYRYEVTHDVALGFPLVGGEVPIEVIVDLPEGGDSRYTTTAFLASCYFSANVSGDTAAFFDGPAQFQVGMDGSINIYLRSRGYINGDLATSVQANFGTGPGTPLEPGNYNITGAAVNFSQPVYSAYYLPEADLDCASCGGSVTIDTLEEEQSVSGSASFTLVRVIPEPEGEEEPPVTLDVEFVAAYGSQFDGGSPYVQCSILYGD